MKGYRTLIFNGSIAVVTAILTWAAGINWTEYVSPTWAMIIIAGANAFLRMITDTKVGQNIKELNKNNIKGIGR